MRTVTGKEVNKENTYVNLTEEQCLTLSDSQCRELINMYHGESSTMQLCTVHLYKLCMSTKMSIFARRKRRQEILDKINC